MEQLRSTDVLDLHLVGHVAISPDGTRVAFIEASFDIDADETVWHIRVMPTDWSQAPRDLTAGGRRDSLPRWAPDGRSIAFLSARDEPWRQDLHLVEVETGATRRVTVLPRGIEGYAWSPRGDAFALTGKPDYPDAPGRPAATTAEERRQRYIQRVIHVERMDYRGPSAFFDDEASQLWWCPLGGEPVALTEGPYPVEDPGWAPDGRITFRSARVPDFDQQPFVRIWAVPTSGGEPEPLTDPVNQLRGHSVGTDGSVAWVGLPTADWSFGSHDPHLFVDGKDVTEALDRPVSRASEVQSLTLDYLTSTETPVRGSDGTLYFHVVDAGCAHVYRLRDGVPEPVVVGRRVVGDFCAGGDTLVFSASSPSEPVALWACDPAGGGERLLYDPNPQLSERAVGEIRHFPVRLDSGEDMDAWAVLPAGHDGGPLPAVLDIHPGPHSSFPWDYRVDQRILANAGYAVLSCNQPGSQGYGEEYAQRLDGAWGEADLPAYLATCDEAARLGFADADRLGVTGATYGGFAALWAVAHTDRFKAAVTNRAITNLDAMYGDCDVGWSFLAPSIGAEPWEDPERYRRLSPTTYVTQIDAPVRLLAFAGNERTTVAASEAIYRRLRKLGKPTDLLVFPPGSATVVMPNRPWSKVALLDAAQEWFDRYVKPSP